MTHDLAFLFEVSGDQDARPILRMIQGELREVLLLASAHLPDHQQASWTIPADLHEALQQKRQALLVAEFAREPEDRFVISDTACAT